jgi:hypothetical protein
MCVGTGGMIGNGGGGSEDSKSGEGNVVLRASDLAQVGMFVSPRTRPGFSYCIPMTGHVMND